MTSRLVALALCVALVIACARQQAGASGERQDIFRYVQLNRATINLGEPLPVALDPPPAGDTVLSLTPDQFGVAQGIRIHLTPTGLVRAVWFDYGPRTDFQAMIAEYAGSLGAPRREPFRRGERVVWEDASTRFELVHDPERNAATVFSILTDKRTSSPGAG